MNEFNLNEHRHIESVTLHYIKKKHKLRNTHNIVFDSILVFPQRKVPQSNFLIRHICLETNEETKNS